jgi:hypothetical protein
MKEIYVIKMVTGAGYDCSAVGYFENKVDASVAVCNYLVGKGLEAHRQEQHSDTDGRTCLSFHITNRGYFLEFNIFKEVLNELMV